MTDFFISYTGADQAWAEWIAWVLEEAGNTVVIQAWDFRPGGNFVVDMQKAAAKCERTIAVLSPDYSKSTYAIPEWTAAFSQDPSGEKKTLLPVRVREFEPEGLLAQIVYVDLVGLEEPAARRRLLAGLALGRAKPAAQPAFPGERGPRFPGEPPTPLRFPLSEDQMPEPGPLPAGSRMPLPLNPLFAGRRDDFQSLIQRLEIGEPSAAGRVVLVAVTGLGGVGKTQLACELVHRSGRSFLGGVFWMSFAEPDSVPAEIAACGESLALHPTYDALPLSQQVRLVTEVWNRPTPRLLVFDDCEEDELLDRWRPRFGSAKVLVTSRRSGWDPALGVREFRLSVLPRSASIDLLLRFRPDLSKDDPALDAIATDLGDLPLALHLAGSFLARYSQSTFGQPAAYLQALRRDGLLEHPSLQGRSAGISPTGHEAHVARTFALSFERLELSDPVDSLAIELLSRAAWFTCGEPIPRFLLLATLNQDSDNVDAALQAEDALAQLLTFGLVEPGEKGSVIVHRLVAAFARRVAGADAARTAVESAMIHEAERINRAGIPGPLLAWQAHLRGFIEASWDREDAQVMALCNEFGFHLLMIGDYSGSGPYLERALTISERVLGPKHPNTAQSLNNVGGLLHRQGNFLEARPYLERALSIWTEVHGSEHPQTALGLNHLGFLLQKQGDLAGASSNYEWALAIREKVLGPEHPDTAASLNNLGGLLQSQGDFAGARPYVERAVEILERSLGPEHPGTAFGLNRLGAILQSQGDLARARPYYQRALAIREKVLGPEHPDTALSLNNLGRLLQSQGDLTGAWNYHKRALAIRKTVLGSEHPDTAQSLNNLGSLLQDKGDLTAARDYHEQALAIREKVLGSEHPDTAQSLNNFGSLLQDQGDFEEARSHYEQALAILEARLGPDHPNTKIVRGNLAALNPSPGDESSG